jgi:hypothetical protein
MTNRNDNDDGHERYYYDQKIRNTVMIVLILYLINAIIFSKTRARENPSEFPKRRTYIAQTIFLFLFALPLALAQALWVLMWIVFWEILRKPLWKPLYPHKFKENVLGESKGENERMRRERVQELTAKEHANVSLCGGGFRTWYHLGVYFGLRDNFGEDGIDDMVFSGASIGALVACLAGCNVKPEEIWKQIPPIAHEFRELDGFLRNFTSIGKYCRYLLNSLLPEDAHLRCNGRVFLSITKLFPTPHNEIISEWHSRADLIDCVLACGYIPGWTWPCMCIYDNNICVDGGVTNNLPSLHENSLRVGLDADDLIHWDAVLCPSEALPRINTFIPADDVHLTQMVEEGKDDFENFLDTKNGIEFAQRCLKRKKHRKYSIEIDSTVTGFHR